MAEMDEEARNEFNMLKAYAHSNGCTSALALAADTIIKLRKALSDAEAAMWPPRSVQEAFNSGDGSYHP